MHKSTHIGGGETPGLAGLVEVSPSVAASPGDCVVIQFPVPSPAAASEWDLDAMELDGFEPLGSIAVRLVGSFALPRILVFSGEGDREDDPPHL